MHPSVQEFLDTHTKGNKGGVSSTFRDSKTAPYHWKKDLPFERILKIQEDCAEALMSWGYFIYESEDQLEGVHSVTNYTLLP